MVDRETGRHLRQVRAGGVDLGALLERPVEPQIGLLDEVLGLAHAAHHPVGDPGEPRPVPLELLRLVHLNHGDETDQRNVTPMRRIFARRVTPAGAFSSWSPKAIGRSVR